MLPRSTSIVCLSIIMLPALALAAPITFSVGGNTDPASIQATVDAFRDALGNPNNLNNPGPLSGGRREINWDGGGAATNTTPPVTPFNVFLNSRGGQFTTPGTGLTQATPEGLGDLVGNATYDTTFSTFSPFRLFAPVGSNIVDALFFLPGTNGNVPATVKGFGAVFTDVDLSDTTQIEYFDASGSSLFSGFVPIGTVPGGSLSFFGVQFNGNEQVARVRITTGNTALGPNDNPTDPTNPIDVVALDDFLYSEPSAVPEPSTMALCGIGVAVLLGVQRSRKTRRSRCR
jgi:hypothetical protein